MPRDVFKYQPLLTESFEGSEGATARLKSRLDFELSRRALIIVIVVQTLALISMTIALAVHSDFVPNHALHGVLYSPALDAVETEVKVFHVGFTGDMSPFQIPSSPELDEAWEDLYSFGISRITKDEAARLPNKTHAIPGDDGHYIAELDVFHNLHCLNMIRKALDPDYYTDWRISTTGNVSDERKHATEHVNHCVTWIQQSLMCASDTSVIVWQWEDYFNKSIVKGNVAHTCRKFSKLQEWAKEHSMIHDYDPTIRIEDDILIPVIHS